MEVMSRFERSFVTNSLPVIKSHFLVPASLCFRFHPPMSDELLPDLLAAVEQQLVSPQTKYVAKTLERLKKAGMEAGEAKSQIALCLGEQMDEMMRTKRGFDEKAYREALDGLPFADDGDSGEEE